MTSAQDSSSLSWYAKMKEMRPSRQCTLNVEKDQVFSRRKKCLFFADTILEPTQSIRTRGVTLSVNESV